MLLLYERESCYVDPTYAASIVVMIKGDVNICLEIYSFLITFGIALYHTIGEAVARHSLEHTLWCVVSTSWLLFGMNSGLVS